MRTYKPPVVNQYEAVLYFGTGNPESIALVRVSCHGENQGGALAGLLMDWSDSSGFRLDDLVQAVVVRMEPGVARNLLAHRP